MGIWGKMNKERWGLAESAEVMRERGMVRGLFWTGHGWTALSHVKPNNVQRRSSSSQILLPRLPSGARSHKTMSALLLRLARLDRAEACEMIRAPDTEPRPGPTFTRSGHSDEIKSMKSNASSPLDGGGAASASMRERLSAIKITSVARTTPRLDIRPMSTRLSRATSIHSMFRPSPSPESIAYR